MCLRLRLLIAMLAVAGVSGKHFSPTFSTKALKIRGGAGPLDPTATAKAYALAAGAQSTITLLGPDKALGAYGLPTNEPATTLLVIQASAVIINTVVLIGSRLLKELSFHDAIGYSCVPYVLLTVHNLMNGKLKRVGKPNICGLLLIALNSWTAYAAFTGADYADTLIKLYGYNSALNAAILFLAPATALKMWMINGSSEATIFITKELGAALAAHAAVVLLPNDLLKAVGICAVAFFVHFLDAMFIRKELVNLKVSFGMLYPWLLFMAVVAGTLLIESADTVEMQQHKTKDYMF